MKQTGDSGYRSYLIAAVVLLILLLLGLPLMFREKLPEQKEEAIEEIYLPGYPLYNQHVERMPVRLYFPDKDLHLRAEDREIYKSEDPANRLRQVLVLLVHGPRSEDLIPIFPEGVRLRELYFHEGCVYVDLKIAGSTKHNTGCYMEYLTLNAVQESLVKNFTEVEKVKLLLNGGEKETLFGHMDIRKPFINLMTGELFETFDRDL